MYSHPLHKDPRLPELYVLYVRKQESVARLRALKRRIQSTQDMLQMEELKSRKRVLRRLGFMDAEDIVDMKGRVACEIRTEDELLLTELIFNGAFNALAPEQCAGLLSCFVFSEKVRSSIVLRVEGEVTLFFAERTGDKVEGGNGGTSEDDARDREAHRQGFQGI